MRLSDIVKLCRANGIIEFQNADGIRLRFSEPKAPAPEKEKPTPEELFELNHPRRNATDLAAEYLGKAT